MQRERRARVNNQLRAKDYPRRRRRLSRYRLAKSVSKRQRLSSLERAYYAKNRGRILARRRMRMAQRVEWQRMHRRRVYESSLLHAKYNAKQRQYRRRRLLESAARPDTLRELIRAAGLTQRAFAEAAGVSVYRVCSHIQERQIPASCAEAYARVLNVSIDKLPITAKKSARKYSVKAPPPPCVMEARAKAKRDKAADRRDALRDADWPCALRQIMQSKKMACKQLATFAGVSLYCLNSHAHGKKIPLRTAQAYARVLGVDAEELM